MHNPNVTFAPTNKMMIPLLTSLILVDINNINTVNLAAAMIVICDATLHCMRLESPVFLTGGRSLNRSLSIYGKASCTIVYRSIPVYH